MSLSIIFFLFHFSKKKQLIVAYEDFNIFRHETRHVGLRRTVTGWK